MAKLDIVIDDMGNKVVLIPDIIFKNKQNIDWNYVKKYVGEIVKITESKDIVYIGNVFPDEFTGSNYTRKTKGARAKAKANATQGIVEMIQIAMEKSFRENHKAKHSADAGSDWYYYITRFALPIYDNARKTGNYNEYSACLVVNSTTNGKMFLYDVVDIKKKRVTHSRLTSSQVVQIASLCQYLSIGRNRSQYKNLK